MERLSVQTVLHSFFIFFVLLTSVSCSAANSDEVENEMEFDYKEGSEKGPDRWGEIHPEWRMCGSGTMQSPIDLMSERVQLMSYSRRLLKNDYNPSNATLINRGHDIKLNWEGGAGYLEINGTQYQLNQCHWHTPSEHTINGRSFDLEVHLVHKSKISNKTAVIGILYKIGHPDPFLSKLNEYLVALANTGEKNRVVGLVDPKPICIHSTRKYYRYIGSLTSPPCTENVVWTIVKKVRTVSREQVKLLREAVHDDYENNARPVQPINRRLVKLYQTQEPDEDGNV